MEGFSECLESQRHKLYVPSNVDTTEYDKHLFQKYLDLEIMRVKVQPAQTQDVKIVREITRERNEPGIFGRLMGELNVIAKEYRRELDEVLAIFSDVNCSKATLRKVL